MDHHSATNKIWLKTTLQSPDEKEINKNLDPS